MLYLASYFGPNAPSSALRPACFVSYLPNVCLDVSVCCVIVVFYNGPNTCCLLVAYYIKISLSMYFYVFIVYLFNDAVSNKLYSVE
jgi:hypothetical protein